MRYLQGTILFIFGSITTAFVGELLFDVFGKEAVAEYKWALLLVVMALLLALSALMLVGKTSQLRDDVVGAVKTVTEDHVGRVKLAMERTTTAVEDVVHSVAQLQWAQASEEQVHHFLTMMARALDESSTQSLDIFTVFHELPTKFDVEHYGDYLKSIEVALEEKKIKRYRRVIICRQRPLKEHLLARPHFLNHFRALLLGKNKEAVTFKYLLGSHGVFDFGFAIFYSLDSQPKSMILELGRWTDQPHPVYGLLEIRNNSEVLLAFAKTFEELIASDSVKRLERDDLLFDVAGEMSSKEYTDRVLEQVAERSIRKLGYSDVLAPAQSEELMLTRAGGGFVVQRAKGAPPTHLHIFPHGGNDFSEEGLPSIASALPRTLPPTFVADEILKQYDAGIPSLASEFMMRMAAGQEPWATSVIAYFGLPRAVVDPIQPIGARTWPRQDRSLLEDPRSVESAVGAWLAMVLDLSAEAQVIFHHHSYRRRSEEINPHDVKPFELRPWMELFTKVEGARFMLFDLAAVGREAREMAGRIRNNYRLETAVKSEFLVGVDEPLRVPGDMMLLRDERKHFIYEIRDDLLIGRHALMAWADEISELVIRVLRQDT